MHWFVYFVSLFVLIGFSYLVFRIIVRRDYKYRKKTTWISVFLETFVFALHANLAYLFIPAKWPALPSLPTNKLILFIGLLLFITGLLITLIGMASLGLKTIFGWGADRVKHSGIYRLSRNPQILAYGLALIGIAVLWPSWYAVGWLLSYGVIAHMMVLTEEEYLSQLHGNTYKKYCTEVPRYLIR